MKKVNRMDEENIILKLLSSYMPVSDELKNVIEEVAQIKNYKKGAILLKEGELANQYFIVVKGCIRSYAIKDGEEKTLEFYTEGKIVLPINYDYETPALSTHFLDCIEDTVVVVSTPEYEKEMLLKFPILYSAGPAMDLMAGKMISDYQSSIMDFKTTSAEDRYVKLMKERPELIQRVPQYLLASYLGVKPETLSRIRKRLSKK